MMPRRADAKYFKGRAEASRVAAARSDVRGAILVHRQMAAEYDRLSKKAEANDALAADHRVVEADSGDRHDPPPSIVGRA